MSICCADVSCMYNIHFAYVYMMTTSSRLFSDELTTIRAYDGWKRSTTKHTAPGSFVVHGNITLSGARYHIHFSQQNKHSLTPFAKYVNR